MIGEDDSSVTIISMECETGKPSLNSDCVIYVHFGTSVLVKEMDPSLLFPPAMG